jgi:rare lipoprotein A
MARRLIGDAELAEIGTPITIHSMPKPKVSSQTLPVIGSNETILPPPVSKPAPPPVAEPMKVAETLISDKVTIEPVPTQTNIFIQAGAFYNFSNANRVRAVLSSLGLVKVSSVLVDGRDMFRVRVGPIKSITNADHMLEQVIASGYTDARTIVD